ncbi:hypothetical protein A3768_2865 [Ralstonia solanacearum]|nr:hypothetical protein A3768_2865 [Ralstonia solanacearum]
MHRLHIPQSAWNGNAPKYRSVRCVSPARATMRAPLNNPCPPDLSAWH